MQWRYKRRVAFKQAVTHMKHIVNHLDDAWNEIRRGNTQYIYQQVVRQFRQEWLAYGLRRDLLQPHPAPAARIPIAIRELQDSDISDLLLSPAITSSRQEKLEIANRIALLAEQIPTCYVAIDLEKNKPCFIQWLMLHTANDRIKTIFKGRFPKLKSDEALLENAYTPEAYRGKGIMPSAMAMTSDMARSAGCRSVITFVLKDNPASLNGCRKAGFIPFLIRRDHHLLFHLIKRRAFTPYEDVKVEDAVQVK